MLTNHATFRRALAALDAFDEPLAFEGTLPAKTIAIVLPSGERAELGPELVTWLLAHAEPAPFGDGQATRTDPTVRRAFRLAARDRARVEGLDLADVLAKLTPHLSPDKELDARLTDVIVYGEGGHFTRHKDTPRGETMIGTLVVCLPIPHTGGALRLSSGTTTTVVLGAPQANAIAWAAFHGDVEHEVLPVTSGHRVVITLALHRSGRAREHATEAALELGRALKALLEDEAVLPNGGTLLLPCARRVIRSATSEELAPSALVGRDREIAAVLAELSLPFRVRSCLAAVPAEGKQQDKVPILAWAFSAVRLRAELPPLDETITWARKAHDDEGEMDDVQSLSSNVVKDGDDVCLIRGGAYATFVHEALFSDSGYFGNDHFDAWLYEFAAIEVLVPDLRARGLVAEPKPRRVRHAKFGSGVVLSETVGDKGPVLEVKFDDGSVRKLMERFLERLDG